MRVKIISEAPGSHGELEIKASGRELALLQRIVKEWNEKNPGHADPVLRIELVGAWN